MAAHNKNKGKTKAVKTSLDSILLPENKEETKRIISDVGDRINRLYVYTAHFIRAYMIHLHHKGTLDARKVLTIDFIRMVFIYFQEDKQTQEYKNFDDMCNEHQILIDKYRNTTNRKSTKDQNRLNLLEKKIRDGPIIIPHNERYNGNISDDNLNLLMEIDKFCEDHGFPICQKIDGTGLSPVINSLCDQIITNTETNIKLRFIDHLNHYVNSLKIDDDLKTKDKRKELRALKRKLYNVKKHLVEYSDVDSEDEYYQFITKCRQNILPVAIPLRSNLLKEITDHPLDFLGYMIKMSIKLEQKGKKQLQVIPLRKQFTTKYFPMDTSVILANFDFNEKKILERNKTDNAPKIWGAYFNMNHKIFRMQDKLGYHFSYVMSTDGYSVSLTFVDEIKHQKNIIKKQKMNEGNRKALIAKSKMNDEQRAAARILRLEKQEAQRSYKSKQTAARKAEFLAQKKEEQIRKKEEQAKKKEEQAARKKEEQAKKKEEQAARKKEEQLKKKEELARKRAEAKKSICRQRGIKKEQNDEEPKRKVGRPRVVKKISEQSTYIKQLHAKSEFPYLDPDNEKVIEELKTKNKVYVDPGKIRIYTMIGKPIEHILPKNKKCSHKGYKGTDLDCPKCLKHSINRPENMKKCYHKEHNPDTCHKCIEKNQESLITCNHKRPQISTSECSRCKKHQEMKILKYSNSQRINETKRNIYRKRLTKHKTEHSLFDKERELNGFNSKSCDLKKFMDYIAVKFGIYDEVNDEYKDPIFRKLRWYSYINTQRSEQNLVNSIKNTYGDDVVLIMGDWSSRSKNHLRGMAPTPMIGIKRMLAKSFKIYNLDEYNTSKICNKTKEVCKKMKLKVDEQFKKKPKVKVKKKRTATTSKTAKTYRLEKIHSILTYKMENNRTGCINRDVNAVLNMKEIGESIIKDDIRPLVFSRSSTSPSSSSNYSP